MKTRDYDVMRAAQESALAAYKREDELAETLKIIAAGNVDGEDLDVFAARAVAVAKATLHKLGRW